MVTESKQIKDSQPQYPECEKLAAIVDKSQEIGQFLDWLKTIDDGIFLGRYTSENDDRVVPYIYDTAKLIARYFEIDMNKVEKEHQQIIDSLSK